MKFRERVLTHNSFGAAYLVIKYIREKHPEVDIYKHERNIQLLFIKSLESKKKRTRAKYRNKMVNYYSYAKKSL